MKRLILISICIIFFMTSTVLHAQEKIPLGNGNVAVKLDYIVFTNDHFDEAFNQDDGLYIGLEGYGKVFPNLYLGERSGRVLILMYWEKK